MTTLRNELLVYFNTLTDRDLLIGTEVQALAGRVLLAGAMVLTRPEMVVIFTELKRRSNLYSIILYSLQLTVESKVRNI